MKEGPINHYDLQTGLMVCLRFSNSTKKGDETTSVSHTEGSTVAMVRVPVNPQIQPNEQVQCLATIYTRKPPPTITSARSTRRRKSRRKMVHMNNFTEKRNASRIVACLFSRPLTIPFAVTVAVAAVAVCVCVFPFWWTFLRQFPCLSMIWVCTNHHSNTHHTWRALKYVYVSRAPQFDQVWW